jgi:hypothetical protein
MTALFVLNTALFISQIGKPREPITPADGALAVIGCAFLIVAFWSI